MSTKERLKVLESVVNERWIAHKELHNALEESVRLARVSIDNRLEGMNEFRQTLSDQSKTFVTREEWSNAHESLNNNYSQKLDGITKLVYMGVGVVSFIAAFSGLIIYFITKAK